MCSSDLVEMNNKHIALMEENEEAFKQKLDEAKEEIERAKKAKQLAHQVLVKILEFAAEQNDALIGFMIRKYHILELEFAGQLESLKELLVNDLDFEFSETDGIMEMINFMNHTNLNNDGKLLTFPTRTAATAVRAIPQDGAKETSNNEEKK